MARMLSIAVAAVFSVLFVSNQTSRAQETEKPTACCKQCPVCCNSTATFEFEVPGVQLPLRFGHVFNSVAGTTAAMCQEEAVPSIPPLTKLPYLGVSFRAKGKVAKTSDSETCQKTAACCPGADKCCSASGGSCTANVSAPVATTESAPCQDATVDCPLTGSVPFLSNVPYVSRLFSNVLEDCPCRGAATECCEDEACVRPCEETTPQPMQKLSNENHVFRNTTVCCDSAAKVAALAASRPSTAYFCVSGETCPAQDLQTCNCPSPGDLVALTSFVADDAVNLTTPQVFSEPLVELRVANERLRTELKAAEKLIEMMRAMGEVREENAALKARLQMMQQHPVHATGWHLPAPPVNVAVPHGHHAVNSGMLLPTLTPTAAPQSFPVPATHCTEANARTATAVGPVHPHGRLPYPSAAPKRGFKQVD